MARAWLFLVASLAPLAWVGCGGAALMPCPDGGTTLTFANFGQPFLEANCNYCHGASAQNRAGAPADFTFDTVDQVVSRRERIAARATGDRPSMPPGPNKPPASERLRLAEWLACAPP